MTIEIEELRAKLNNMMETHDRGSEEVLEVSRALDALIMDFIRKNIKKM